jgi:hypothetical protein
MRAPYIRRPDESTLEKIARLQRELAAEIGPVFANDNQPERRREWYREGVME